MCITWNHHFLLDNFEHKQGQVKDGKWSNPTCNNQIDSQAYEDATKIPNEKQSLCILGTTNEIKSNKGGH